MERGDAISKDVRLHLRIEPVSKSEHLSFNLSDFRFFNSSEDGSAMPFGNSKLLTLIITVPYILSCEAIFFRKNRYFVKFRNRVAGVLVLHQMSEALYISSLAVAPELRRFGVASFILNFTERVAKNLNKECLELSVLKKNLPARRLYSKFGFSLKKERKRTFVLARKV